MNQKLNFTTLSPEEMETIVGGSEGTSLFNELVNLASATTRSIWEFSKSAMDYQASLPTNLKK
ncbi:hypothetical protein [Flavihumibacter fluvii]|uniref:hypothetical protein n=1 Tax=Flavihumibacter fluvii TaxID=2838157 RepID=UPI001BDDD5CC|nr:hypothetical protein [Flavihumibacter fluvii]ULQ50644.1 hypothetical protein KJS93_11185 [Flavihumibacter fluvii]